MKKIKFNIKGMHCSSCAMLISEALEEEKGTTNVKVSLDDNSAKIEFDEKKTNEKRIKDIIKKEGYEVE